MKKKLLALMMVFAMLMSVTPMASASVWDDMAGEMANTEVRNSLDKAIELVEENKDEIYAEAYGYAKAEGYIADAKAALEDLSVALETIEVKGLEEAVAELKEDIAAINAFLDEAETLEAFTDAIWDLLAKFVDDKAVLEELLTEAGEDGWDALEEAYAAIVPCVEEIYTVAYEMMEEAYDDVVEAIAALAAEYGPAAEEFVYEWLYENPKAVMETILAYGEDIDALLNHWAYHVGLILGPAWNAYGDELVDLVEDLLAVLEDETSALTEEAAAALVEYVAGLELDTQVETIVDALKDGSIAIGEETVAELEPIVAELEANLTAKVDAIVEALEAVAEGNDVAAAKAEVQAAIDAVLAMEAELMAELDCIDADIAALYELAEDAAEEVEAVLAENSDITIGELAAVVQTAAAYIEAGDFAALENFLETKEGVAVAVEHAEDLLKLAGKAMEIAGETAKEISTLTADITAAAEKIDAQLIALNGELETAVEAIEAALTAAGADAEALLGEACAAVDAFVTTTVDTVITDANALVAACELELTTAVNEFVAAVETTLYKATHGDVTVDCVATYTAIGDEADVYTSDLAELLGVKVADLDDLDDLAELEVKPALVTIEFDGKNLSDFVNGQIAGMIAETIKKDPTMSSYLNNPYLSGMIQGIFDTFEIDLTATVETLDWGKYLDGKAIDVKNDTLEGIRTVMIDHGLDEVYDLPAGKMINAYLGQSDSPAVNPDMIVKIRVADLVIAALDNLLYAYVDTAAQCVGTIEYIREVAPEAEVVILGLENAAEELQIKVGNIAIDLGEYEDAIGTFANVHYFAYALLNGEDVTFVAEKDAEAIYAALNVTDLGHDWVAVVTEPTCTEGGYTTYTCANGCDEDPYTADETDALGHNYVDGVCTRCDDEEDKGGPSRDWHCPTCKTDVCHSKAFSDLDLNAWYHKYTDYVLCKGMMNGMGGDIFAPNATTTRAMIITTLYRMEGSPVVSGEIAYSDVAAGTWYTDAVIWGTQNGIVKGYENATFDPMGSVTREQIAAIFNRYATYKKVDTKKAAASLDAYVDAAQVSAWAVEDMKWAVGNKFIVGRTDTTLVPNGATTRAEMATLLYRWANEIAK